MSHPYESYIETKAKDYYSRQAHEPQCETLQPYDYSKQPDPSGFVYDIYIIQHCDCWLTENFDNLTTERKFESLRNLAHSHPIHPSACGRYRKSVVNYRNGPEVMTGWCNCWLSVPFPDDTPVDRVESLPVEYNETPEQEKEHTMSDLSRATHLAEEAEQAQRNIDNFLAPFIKDFAAFMTKHNPRGYDIRDFDADTFVEIDASTFYLKGEEEYSHGEYYAPSLYLPFSFVENPAAFKEDYLRTQAQLEASKKAKLKANKEAEISRLEAQLAKARASL